MKRFKLSLLGFSVMMLAACSSGGGSSDNESQSVDSSTTSTQSASTDTNASSSSSSNTSNESSNTTSTASSNSLPSNVTEVNSSNINEIEIDGVTYTLIPNGIHSGSYVNLNNNIVSDGRFDNLRYGFIQTISGHHAFYVGSMTAENQMPTQGSATYKGDFIHADYNTHTIYRPVQGGAEFNVDFSNKTLTGKLENAGGTDKTVAISANINGSEFNGTNNGTYTKGAFYGSNAAELAGAYQNKTENYLGVYAAKKQ